MKCWRPVTRGRNVFCWPEQRRSLASGQKMKPPIFPAEETSFELIYRRGQGEQWQKTKIFCTVYMCPDLTYKEDTRQCDPDERCEHRVMSDGGGESTSSPLDQKIMASSGLLHRISRITLSEENYHRRGKRAMESKKKCNLILYSLLSINPMYFSSH